VVDRIITRQERGGTLKNIEISTVVRVTNEMGYATLWNTCAATNARFDIIVRMGWGRNIEG